MAKITINDISLDPEQHDRELTGRGLSSTDASQSNYILVQVNGPLTRAKRDQLTNLGVQLLEFVPEDTYIARYDKDDLSPIERLNFVVWANQYLKGFKVARNLMARENIGTLELMGLAEETDAIGSGSQFVDIVFHQGVDVQNVIKKVAATAGLDPNQVQADGGKIRVNVERARLRQVAAIDEIRHIEKVFERGLNNDVAIQLIQADQAHQAQVPYRGNGQIVAVCDTGFDTGVTTGNVHPAFTGRVNNLYALGRPGVSDDPHGHGTHVAGSVLGDGPATGHGQVTGTAPDAQLVLQSVIDVFGGLGGIPNNLNNLFRDPHQTDGARVHNNSWSYTNSAGRYNSDSREVDEYVWNNRNFLVCFAAGNEATDANQNGVIDLGSVTAPGTAKNCITVGASENDRTNQSRTWSAGWPADFPADPIADDLWADNPSGMAAFSGRGPTRDGRIKPDLVAPGTSIISAHSRNASVGTFWGTSPDPDYCYMGGTSMATPLISGCATLVREYLIRDQNINDPSAALVKALLINSATKLPGQYIPSEAGQLPNFVMGFGRVDMVRALGFDSPMTYQLHDEGRELDVGEEDTHNVNIPEGATSIKVTLVWSDFPGNGLQNDLDLIVKAADGTEWHGNLPEPGNPGFDRLNNVEQIWWQNPPTGQASVIVHAYRIPLHNQSYALVIRVN